MNRIALTLMLLFAIAGLLFCGLFVQFAKSQFLGDVSIASDGSVVGTTAIQRNGDIYTLTASISGGIQVQKSNIVIDGAGYTVQGNEAGRGIDLSYAVGEGSSRSIVSNVTVKNLRIVNFGFGIATNGGGNNTFCNNYIGDCGEACINLMACSYNNITFCTIEGNSISMNYQANYNTITKNNFLNAYVIIWLSGYETIDMNYWSDYNGTDADGDGIGDTPYGHPQAILDTHPLMKPVSSAIPGLPDGASNTPTVPEFTVAIVASSLEVAIKNQPITAFVDTNGSNSSLYYGFRFKDHENIQDWNYDPPYYVLPSSYGTYYEASNLDYTVVSFTFESYPLTGILGSGKVDVQVMALIGNEFPTNYENGTVYGFDGVASVWSSTQTKTIGGNASMQQIPFSTLLVITALGVSLAAVGVGVLVYFRRRKR